jgi:hypothetical protein
MRELIHTKTRRHEGTNSRSFVLSCELSVNRIVARASRPCVSSRTGETPVPLPKRRFMAGEQVRKEQGAFHEPNDLARLFPGAPTSRRLKAWRTGDGENHKKTSTHRHASAQSRSETGAPISGRCRFMGPNVHPILEVAAFHEPENIQRSTFNFQLRSIRIASRLNVER